MKRSLPQAPRPNITSLIDIVLLLVIFFMVASHFARTSREDVDLPQVDEPSDLQHREEDLAIVNVLSNGQIRISGAGFALNEVKDFVAARLSRVGVRRLKVYIRADRDVPFGRVKQIMREVSAAGARSVAFAVLEKP